jgi:hypothetical protein
MSNVIELHETTVSAIRAQLKMAEARECRLLVEIAQLHETVGYMRSACQMALGQCMHQGSIQAVTLKDAIERSKQR